ncbi:MAG: Blue-light-activated protein [candidate division BRC1 bacterium ADurb.BinA364]|nr:MAG: Blue-light-activated protein [candidate division BRC1 bacterium ADurb.BinA364]
MESREEPHEMVALRKDGSTFPCESQGRTIAFQGRMVRIASVRDISARKIAEAALARRMNLEKIVRDISADFVRRPMNELDDAIRFALETIGGFVGADRAYVFRLRPGGDLAHNTHEWSAEGIEPQIANLQGIALDTELPWFAERLRRLEICAIADVAALPEEAARERAHFQAQGIRSLIVAPLVRREAAVGFLGFDWVRSPAFWLDDSRHSLTAVADILIHALSRKETELALRRSERRYREMVQNIPIGLYQNTPGPDGRFVMANLAISRMFGYESPEEFMRSSVADLYADPGERQEFSQRLLEHGEVVAEELRLKKRDGTPIWGAVTARVVRDESDNIVYFDGMIEDITERKNAYAERERLAAAIGQAAESVIVTAADGTIQYVNPAFERTTGYSREEAIGQTPRILKSGKHDEAFYRDLWQTLLQGRTWEKRIVNKRKDGSLFTEEAAISPVRDAQGNIVHFVAVNRNVTREIELEEQLRQSQKMEAVGQLAGGVAHDFNNLLQVIIGYTEMARRDLDPRHTAAAALAQVTAAGNRAAELVGQLLAFSRRQVMRPASMDLNAAIDVMAKMLRRIVGEHIRFDFRPGSELGRIYADRGMIEQVLMNLVVNARDAMPNGGALTVSTENVTIDESFLQGRPWAKPGLYVRLRVADTGHGMDRKTLERIFEPFFSTKEMGKGTGLGLATAYGIVKQHNGMILASSEPGQGAVFDVYLPTHAEAAIPPREPDELSARGGSETILLAEDEPMVRDLSRKILERAGYKVLAAQDGAEAVAIFREHIGKVDLLLLDAVMPNASGRTALERIRNLQPDMPALFASGYSEDALFEDFASDDTIHLIQKPFSANTLLAKVRETLDAARGRHG